MEVDPMIEEAATKGMKETAEAVKEALVAVFGEAVPATVFSEPEQVGDSLLINAVAWERAGGFGFGAGSGTGPDEEGGSGSGGGGGGASQGRPVAVIQVTEDGVTVNPVIDFTKIGVTLLFGLVGLWRALRS
jgi:uncharacterized spore protein YtfJ